MDRDRSARLRLAVALAGGMLAVALTAGALTGGLTVPFAVLWAAGALAVYAVLAPPRVVAGEGLLTVRAGLRTRRVCTDALVGARVEGRTARRVVLRDAAGGRVELDVHLLADSPVLRHELDRAVRRSHRAGLLGAAGAGAVTDLVAAEDAAQARLLLRGTGLG